MKFPLPNFVSFCFPQRTGRTIQSGRIQLELPFRIPSEQPMLDSCSLLLRTTWIIQSSYPFLAPRNIPSSASDIFRGLDIFTTRQRSCGKVMFSQACVILLRGRGHAWRIWLGNGRYASYWNAVLLNSCDDGFLILSYIFTVRSSCGKVMFSQFCPQSGLPLRKKIH